MAFFNFHILQTGGGYYVKTDGIWSLRGILSNIRTVYDDTCSDYSAVIDVEKYLKWIVESEKSAGLTHNL